MSKNAMLVLVTTIVLAAPWSIFQSSSGTQCVRHAPDVYYQRSDVIFVGTVVEIDRTIRFLEKGYYVSLNVSKSWKGADDKLVTVHSEGGRFRQVGTEYLVYADKNFLAIEVSFCGGTIETDSEAQFVDRELSFLESQPKLELKDGHATSMNPFPILGLTSLLAASGAAVFGVIKSGVSFRMIRNAMPAIAGLLLGVLLILTLSNITFPSLAVCRAKPLEHVEKLVSFPVMVPTVLPEGYEFQGADISKGNAGFSLQYFDKPVCGRNFSLTVFDGVILVSGSSLDSRRILENTSAQYLDMIFQQYKNNPAEVPQRYSFEDGREALTITAILAPQHTTYVLIADDRSRTWYEVITIRPPEEAVAIAESLTTISAPHPTAH